MRKITIYESLDGLFYPTPEQCEFADRLFLNTPENFLLKLNKHIKEMAEIAMWTIDKELREFRIAQNKKFNIYNVTNNRGTLRFDYTI